MKYLITLTLLISCEAFAAKSKSWVVPCNHDQDALCIVENTKRPANTISETPKIEGKYVETGFEDALIIEDVYRDPVTGEETPVEPTGLLDRAMRFVGLVNEPGPANIVKRCRVDRTKLDAITQARDTARREAEQARENKRNAMAQARQLLKDNNCKTAGFKKVCVEALVELLTDE